MNYEQKYKEALAWMRDLYPELHGATKEDAEHYFPELAESEDERIRQWIIVELQESLHEIQLMYSGDYDGRDDEDRLREEYLKKAIAYLEKLQTKIDEAWLRGIADAKKELEKQKELSELGKYIAAERTKPGFMFAGNDSVSWEELPLDIRKHDYPYYFIGDLDCYPFDVEKQKEQKRDLELNQHWYMDGYTDGALKKEPRWNLKAGEGGPMYEKNEKYGQPLEQKEQKSCSKGGIPPLDYYQGIMEGRSDVIDHPEQFGLQKPAEWSEEDKEWIAYFERLLEFAYNKDPRDLGSCCVAGKMWLKSLRPQYHWKPSEEQISEFKMKLSEFVEAYNLAAIDCESDEYKSCDGNLQILKNKYSTELFDLAREDMSRWKPSEEQMEALEWVVDAYMDRQTGSMESWKKVGALKELLERLKAL